MIRDLQHAVDSDNAEVYGINPKEDVITQSQHYLLYRRSSFLDVYSLPFHLLLCKKFEHLETSTRDIIFVLDWDPKINFLLPGHVDFANVQTQ